MSLDVKHPAPRQTGSDRPAVRAGDSIADLVGNTPLVRHTVADAAPGAELFLKLESANPLSSVKDRAALYMLRQARERGDLLPGGTVIEATSGNTGIALAALAAAQGHRCIIVLPDSATAERVSLLKALGAEVVQTPREKSYPGAIEKAQEIHAQTPGSWFACQHENADNVLAHYETTGPEIWADTAGTIDVLVCGVGTGGTITGAGKYLREHRPELRIVAVEPAMSPLLSTGVAGTHAIPGYNGGFVAPTTDVSLLDEIITVADDDAAQTARRLARTAGIFAGVSSGAATWAAEQLIRRPELAGKRVVVVLPDTGERYLSIWHG